MGAPSQEQIDEAIALGVEQGLSEDEMLVHIAELERLSDAELATYGIRPGFANAAEPRQGETPEPDSPAFEPAPVRTRHDGWTAQRQRDFIRVLTETGCVSEACAEVQISARSAYRLREHPKAQGFRAAWDHALSLSTARLSALAFERAVHGTVEQVFHKGELVGERRRPDNRLLMWLLSHHDPVTYGYLSKPQKEAPHTSFYPARSARAAMPKLSKKLSDVPFDECPVEMIGIGHPDYDDSQSSRA